MRLRVWVCASALGLTPALFAQATFDTRRCCFGGFGAAIRNWQRRLRAWLWRRDCTSRPASLRIPGSFSNRRMHGPFQRDPSFSYPRDSDTYAFWPRRWNAGESARGASSWQPRMFIAANWSSNSSGNKSPAV